MVQNVKAGIHYYLVAVNNCLLRKITSHEVVLYTLAHLGNIKQRENESLKSYLANLQPR